MINICRKGYMMCYRIYYQTKYSNMFLTNTSQNITSIRQKCEAPQVHPSKTIKKQNWCFNYSNTVLSKEILICYLHIYTCKCLAYTFKNIP